MTSIAFIGLGAMGAPMAENLVKHQFRVTGFDMRESARAALVNARAREAAAPVTHGAAHFVRGFNDGRAPETLSTER